MAHLPPTMHLHPLGLWGHLSHKGHSQVPPPSSSSISHAPPIAPIDKAGTSTRILLHDTQAHLEKFTERVTQLASAIADAKRELVVVQKLYQEDHEQLLERMIGLANRCQTELQKTIGNPAQCTEVRDVARDVNGLAARMEALDKKLDMLGMSNQTQSQALQTIQDQQGQILTALLPILPLLQSIPLHIEGARNHVEKVVSGSETTTFDLVSRFESLVKDAQGSLRCTIDDAVAQLRDGVTRLCDRLDQITSEKQHTSIPTSCPAALHCGLDDQTSLSDYSTGSRPQKRARTIYPDGSDATTLLTPLPDSKKQRLDGPSIVPNAVSVTVPETSHVSRLSSYSGCYNVAGSRMGSIRVASASPSQLNLIQKSPMVASAYNTTLLRSHLGDPQPPEVTSHASPSAASSVVGQTCGSRSVTDVAPSVGVPSHGLAFSQDSTPVPPAVVSTPITPGSFKLPLPALRSGHVSSFMTPTRSQAHVRSSLQSPVPGATLAHKGQDKSTPSTCLPDGSHRKQTPHGPAAQQSRPASRSFRSTRLAASVSASQGHVDLDKGKPMSLKDRRALTAEYMREEGKRFIPLDDEDEEDMNSGG